MVGNGAVTTYTASLDGATGLIEQGKVKAIVSNIYPLADAAKAHAESETKHVRGKLVLEIRKED
jgi:NADPH:quinone reductase-like Zn-dependent oxidoreductase